jgi:hypothetical protein
VELVSLAPDVGPGAGDFVLARFGVEFRGAFDWGRTDVVRAGKQTEISGLTESRGG